MKRKPIYSEHPLIVQLNKLYTKFFRKQSKPTLENLVYLSLAILAFNACTSIHFSHKHLLYELTQKCLNSFYYTMNEADINYDDWMKEIVVMAFLLIPKELKNYPILFAIDDTLVEKEGDCFEAKKRLYDHTKKNGSNYLNGHCFVSLLMMVPILYSGKVQYISVPVAHRMWTEDKSKLQVAAELILKACTYTEWQSQYFVLCDSWYPKAYVSDLNKIPNISIICNARVDTVLYSLPQRNENEARKRGRPRAFGDKIDLSSFTLVDVPNCDYKVGYKWVKTRLFGSNNKILAIVTESKEKGTRRLFLCTNPSICENFDISCFTDKKAIAFVQADRMFIALAIYAFRWNIEKMFFELKTFWNFRDYKLRRKIGVERLLNLQMLTYGLVSMLPYLSEDFTGLAEASMQERRFLLGRLVDRQLFFERFVRGTESGKKSSLLEKAYEMNTLRKSVA